MVFNNKYVVGIEQVGVGNMITNKAILSIMEDIASLHSANVGFGLMDITRTQKGWILLDWQLKIIRRPLYNETLDVYTWSRKCERAWAFRDFEFKDESGELVAIATSRWILFDIQARRPLRITEDIASLYDSEPQRHAFDEEPEQVKCEELLGDRQSDVQAEASDNKFIYKVMRRDIDINQHMHNINYLDVAYEALSQNIYDSNVFNEVRIQYKKELQYNDVVECYYIENEGWHLVIMQSDGKINAVVALR